MSIFYPQDKWHLLLDEIADIFQKTKVEHFTDRILIFFNHHRGESIRLIFEFRKDQEKTVLTDISDRVKQFLSNHAAIALPSGLPVNSFFVNFPYNEIHYNLFNERMLAPDPVTAVQSVLSDILFHVFRKTEVNETAILALLIHLSKSVLNGLNMNNQFLQVQTTQKALKDEPELNDCEIRELARTNVFDMTKTPSVNRLFQEFEDSVRQSFRESGNIIADFNMIMTLIQLHFYKLPDLIMRKAAYYSQLECMSPSSSTQN